MTLHQRPDYGIGVDVSDYVVAVVFGADIEVRSSERSGGACYPVCVSEPRIERTLQAFDSHAEADEATFEYYRKLTPAERLEIALELMRPHYEAHPRFERVYRTADLGECPVSRDRWVGV